MIVRAQRGLRSNHSPSSTMRPDHVVHVVGLARRVGQHVEQLLVHALHRVGRLALRRRLLAVLREEREVAPDRLDAVLVGLDLEVAHAGYARVDARAAELLLGHVLAGDGLREVRPGERHRAAALHHRHEVGEPRDVGRAGRARSHERGHLRHDPAHHHLLAEQVARAREQRAGRLLDARAGGVEQPDHRDALGERELAQARDLQLAGHPHRAGHHGEVVGGHRHEPAVDLAVAGDHAVGGCLLALHRPLGEVRPSVDAELRERALVDQQRQPLARGELALLVLARDLLLAAAELRVLATLVQLLHERAQRRARHEHVRGRAIGHEGAPRWSRNGSSTCMAVSVAAISSSSCSGASKAVTSSPTSSLSSSTESSRS